MADLLRKGKSVDKLGRGSSFLALWRLVLASEAGDKGQTFTADSLGVAWTRRGCFSFEKVVIIDVQFNTTQLLYHHTHLSIHFTSKIHMCVACRYLAAVTRLVASQL